MLVIIVVTIVVFTFVFTFVSGFRVLTLGMVMLIVVVMMARHFHEPGAQKADNTEDE